MKKFLLTLIVAFAFTGSIFAQGTHWPEYNDGAFEDNSTIIAFVQIDGEYVAHTANWASLEVCSYVNDEPRGASFMVSYPEDGDPYAILESFVAFNSEGETVTFKMWDHDNGILYEDCTTSFDVITGVDHTELYFNYDAALVISFTTPDMPFPYYPWTPSTAYSGEGMQVTAQIQIDGQPVDRDSFDVGAFCGEECRGNYKPLEDFDELGYFAMMNIMGNDGDVINFYLYDLENQSLVDGVCYTTVTLENGGELGIDIYGDDIFVLNFVTTESYRRTVTGYGTSDGGYVLIATPINGIAPGDVTNLVAANATDYDLYAFDQNPTDGDEWRNFKANAFTTLESGKGYLYARKETAELVFAGTPYDGNGQFPLVYSGGDFAGMNLMGNPFTVEAYSSLPYYTLNDEGEFVSNATDVVIPAMFGAFVCAEGENETVTFSTTAPGKTSHLDLNLVSSSKLVDRAIVNFGDQQLPKFQLNANSTKLYFPMSDNDYAVVSSQEMGELPLNFKAEKSGSYTLAVNSENVSFGYLHLIDNLTGTDTDLLANPNYSFEASTTDYASRFKLVFATGNASDEFAFFSNGAFVINNDGNATLQVVDVTGRIISSETINGCASVSVNAAPGVYMIRLVNGSNEKVQKVIVK